MKRGLTSLLICTAFSTSALAGPGEAERSRLIAEAFRKGDAKARARAKLADLIRSSALTKGKQRGRLEQVLEALRKARQGEGGKLFELVKSPKGAMKPLIAPELERQRRIEQERREVRELAPLQDQMKWNSASVSDQNLAIAAVTRKLGSAYAFVETKRYSCGGQSFRIASFRHKKSGLLLNLIPGGTYRRGSESAGFDEKPVTTVKIPPMLVGQTEVTQRAWDKVGGEDDREWRGGDLPIERVSWNDCTTWLEKAGDGLRLLSESEWEYACRAGTQSKYFFGNSDSEFGEYAWYSENSGDRTHPVAEKKSNAFGLFDTHGNVCEWCQDWYVYSYKTVPRDHTPYDKVASDRVRRGGSWYNSARYCRSAYRYRDSPGDRDDNLGFRVARGIN